MNRREMLQKSAALGIVAASPVGLRAAFSQAKKPGIANQLKPPADGAIPVAILLSEGAVVIDFCGPWEVFNDVSAPGRDNGAFDTYTVAENLNPIHTSGGMKIVPDHTFDTAPAPKIIVIPAQRGRSEATLQWVRQASKNTDVTMSVCTGAFLLAKTGLLSGKAATTHHSAYDRFASQFPDVKLKRGARFVDEGNIATAGGLSSGIDLALHVVTRYFGQDVAKTTAYYMEYQGKGWMDSGSNAVYA